MFKRLARFMCVAMLVPMIAGCSGSGQSNAQSNAPSGGSTATVTAQPSGGETNNETASDTTNTDGGAENSGSNYAEFLSIDVFDSYANYQGMQSGWFGEMVKEKFNMELNIISPNVSGGGDSLYQTRSAAGNLGDLVLYKAQGGALQDLVTAQLILDLTPYLDGKENLGTYMEAIQYTSQNNVEEEGLYCVPSEVSTRNPTDPLMGNDPNSALYVRWDLYEQLGYPEINTLEDLLPILKDMQELNPTSDSGQPTYGISLFKDWDGDSVGNAAELGSMYGYDRIGYALMKADGSGDIKNMLDMDSQYLRALRFYNKANQMGILDPESTTQNFDTLTSKYADGAVMYSQLPWHGPSAYNVEAHINEGKGMYMADLKDANIRHWGAYNKGNTEIVFMVGSKAKDPQRMVDFIDWLYSPDGIASGVAGYYGPENILYTIEADGPVLTDMGKEFFLNGDATTPESYGGGSWKDGSSKLSYKIISAGDTNPETGITYDPTLWDSYAELFTNPVMQKWQEHMGATNPFQFLTQNNKLMTSPGISFTSAPDSTEISTLRSQVGSVIKENSWKAIFAATDEECEQYIQAMIETAKGLGYDDVFAVDEARAQMKREAWASVK